MAKQSQATPPATNRILRSEKGVALMIALFAMMLLTFIAIEVSYDTTVDYVVASQQVNRIKAHYAAKSGVEISLLRIMLYKQALASFGSSIPDKALLDPIWSFPFMWPPTAMGAGKVNEVDKSMINDVTKESFMAASYATTITPEGGRLDINDLGSDLKSMKASMIAQVVKIFRSEVEHNEEFADKYSGYRFEELVNNIADYIDEDKESLNGGDENAPYRDLDDKDIEMPPNRPLRTVDELHQIAGMTEDFYKILAPRITVFGTKGVNINYTDKETLMALDPSMTEEAVGKVIERRGNPKLGGPFKNEKDFFNFIQGYGVNYRAIEESKVPLLFDVEFNFRVVSTGLSSNVKREITVITYDYSNLVERYAKLLDKRDQEASGGPGAPAGGGGTPGAPDESAAPKIQGAKGRPSVVYWEEN
ncbi:MAG: general secretion pathway protein GspK [Bdellovibrionaceae bacterium]|nr:general secretion pathway protein GspK [Pseudobdellovibrionaceae bacterium]